MAWNISLNLLQTLQQMGPKGQHFLYLGMVTRSQLAIIDLNKRSEFEHATTKAWEKIYNVCFLEITNSCSSKPIKGKEERSYLKNTVNETIEHASSNKSLPIPKIPNKQEIMKKQISRFK